jgi:predicted regulator of Ras-like GTPase activity (Roadblock/LC7/MglB family)
MSIPPTALAQVADRFPLVADQDGFALIVPDGTVLFAKFAGPTPDRVLDHAARLLSSTNAVTSLSSSSVVEQMQVEWEERVLLIKRQKDKSVYIVLIGKKTMNLGLAKILIKDLSQALEQFLNTNKAPQAGKEKM